jgi:hypothetical protein
VPFSSGPSLASSAWAGCDLRNHLARHVRGHARAWSDYRRGRALVFLVGWKWRRRQWAVLVILVVRVNAAAAVGGMASSVSQKSIRAV